MFQLSFQYPFWFFLICVLLGFGYAALLYYRDSTFRERHLHLHRLLGLLRWATVTIISALLLAPLLRSVTTETKKPVVVLAQDVSESIGASLSGTKLDDYKKNWETLRASLMRDFEVRELSFGDGVRAGNDFVFNDKVTNLSELMQGIHDLYAGPQLGSVVIASDGIYNEGSSPVYGDTPLNVPIYTIALGDSTPGRDLLLKRVFHNKIAYLGDRFTIQVDVSATNCSGRNSILQVSKVSGSKVKVVQSIPLGIDSDDYFTTKEVVLDAEEPGVAQYLIRLVGIPGEDREENNRKDIFVDILDARQKILLLANSPHPDISAVRRTIEGNKNYQVSVAYAGDAGLELGKYDVIILHNLPSQRFDISGLLRIIKEKRMPVLFIAGMQVNYASLAREQGLFTMQGVTQQMDDVQGVVSDQFEAFKLDARTVEYIPRFTPVNSIFGSFTPTAQAQVVLQKRIGRIDTNQPLLLVGENNGTRMGVFLGEGLWKWRLFDFLQHGSHIMFDELMGKTIQYLSVRSDKRKFRINLDKRIFNENEPVTMGAELYDDTYSLTNFPDVTLLIRDEAKKEYNYTFSKVGKAYELNAGVLPAGGYQYTGSVVFNGQRITFEGTFRVRQMEMELFEPVANHALLRQLSDLHGGELVPDKYLATLSDKIRSNTAIKPIIYETAETKPLIHLKWLFFLIAGLLTAEWFLRRYFGAY